MVDMWGRCVVGVWGRCGKCVGAQQVCVAGVW